MYRGVRRVLRYAARGAKVVYLLGALGVVCGLLRGWGSSIVGGVEVVREFLVEANIALKPHTKQPALELIEAVNYAVDQLLEPATEVLWTVLELGLRFVFQAACYLASGVLTVILGLLWRGAQESAYYFGILHKDWCFDACGSSWGEVACVLFCPKPNE